LTMMAFPAATEGPTLLTHLLGADSSARLLSHFRRHSHDSRHIERQNCRRHSIRLVPHHIERSIAREGGGLSDEGLRERGVETEFGGRDGDVECKLTGDGAAHGDGVKL
jgi:hypothetical protein